MHSPLLYSTPRQRLSSAPPAQLWWNCPCPKHLACHQPLPNDQALPAMTMDMAGDITKGFWGSFVCAVWPGDCSEQNSFQVQCSFNPKDLGRDIFQCRTLNPRWQWEVGKFLSENHLGLYQNRVPGYPMVPLNQLAKSPFSGTPIRLHSPAA